MVQKSTSPGSFLGKSMLLYYGFGYVSATDEYKVIVRLYDYEKMKEREMKGQAEIFLSRTNTWKMIEAPPCSIVEDGTLCNGVALHWLNSLDKDIVVFDLAMEEFQRLSLPTSLEYGHVVETYACLGSLENCLCLFSPGTTRFGSVDFWVMREYDVTESWTKLFNLNFSVFEFPFRPILVTENCSLLYSGEERRGRFQLIKNLHKEDEIETYMVGDRSLYMIAYEESLLWQND